MLHVVHLTSIVISTARMSCAWPFSCPMSPLIQSLQSPSYCPSFFNTVDTAQLCPGVMPSPHNVRGVVTLNATMVLLAGLNEFVSECGDAVLLAAAAAANEGAALRNSGNYNVRI